MGLRFLNYIQSIPFVKSFFKISSFDSFFNKNVSLDMDIKEASSLFLQKEFKISYDFSKGSIKDFPSEGACVFVANHALGFIDYLIFLNSLLQVREDIFFLVTEFLYKSFSSYKLMENGIPVSFSKDKLFKNVWCLKKVKEILDNQQSIFLFPAGYVSSYSFKTGCVSDRDWSLSVLKLAFRRGIPIVPIYMKAQVPFPYPFLLGLSYNFFSPFILKANYRFSFLNTRVDLYTSGVWKGDSVQDVRDFLYQLG